MTGKDGKPTVTMDTSEAAGAAVGYEDVIVGSVMTPAGLVDMVRGVLCESLVRSVGAVYQFELSGPNGGTFYLDLKHGNAPYHRINIQSIHNAVKLKTI